MRRSILRVVQLAPAVSAALIALAAIFLVGSAQAACRERYDTCRLVFGHDICCMDDVDDSAEVCAGVLGEDDRFNGCAALEPVLGTYSIKYHGLGTYEYDFDIRNDDACDCADAFDVVITLSTHHELAGGCSEVAAQEFHTETIRISGLVKGELKNFNDTFVIPPDDEKRDWYCRFSLDLDTNMATNPEGEVPEKDEDNNSYDTSLNLGAIKRAGDDKTGGDLTPSALRKEYNSSTDKWKLTADVRNNDRCEKVSASAQDVRAEFKVTGCDTGDAFAEASLSSLGVTTLCPGSTRELNSVFIQNGDDSCTCAHVEVDSTTQLTETDETNNKHFNPRPDLSISKLTCDFDTTCPGEYYINADVSFSSGCGDRSVDETEILYGVFSCDNSVKENAIFDFTNFGNEGFTTLSDGSVTNVTACLAPDPWTDCECCNISVDYDAEANPGMSDIDEIDENNNLKNFNEVQGDFAINDPIDVLLGIFNPRPELLIFSNAVDSQSDPLWDVQLSDTNISLAPLSADSFTLTYTLPPGSSPGMIRVVTTDPHGGTQDNIVFVPEPGRIVLVLSGAIGLAVLRRRGSSRKFGAAEK